MPKNTIKKTVKKIKKPKTRNSKQTNKSKIDDDESIDSEYLDELENQKPQNVSDKSDSEIDETEDNRRLRLAKQILQQTKQELQSKNDDFFQDHHDIHMNDEDKRLNVALLEKFAEKHTIYQQQIQKYDREFNREIYKGHLRAITCTEVDEFGKNMYSCSKDSSIIKWDLETKKKEFIQREVGKHGDGHYDEVLTISLNFDGKILASAGKDHSIKLWDTTSNKLIETLKHHKAPIYGVKFGYNSNNLCSISCDRTFIQWDAAQRAYIDTFFGHSTEANDIDCFNADDFLSCGYDRQMIQWKTKSGGQLLYNGHEQSIDCIRALTPETFATGSIDSNINLWNVKKRRPLFELYKPHGDKWITSLGTIYNSDLLISGSIDDNLNIYKVTNKEITKVRSLQSFGIINHINLFDNKILTVESQEHRLGRWITSTKSKNLIVLYL
ncbi:unnamed protein product [Paramecium sonneborni]|uniref:Uncharacterized protein n=1 Tax=Paramecium sonneborni TaxID=65129 RepID=A0A8S1RLZ0_9CILI|nr:unnamed protein product [Paramecium sonneborni]